MVTRIGPGAAQPSASQRASASWPDGGPDGARGSRARGSRARSLTPARSVWALLARLGVNALAPTGEEQRAHMSSPAAGATMGLALMQVETTPQPSQAEP